METITLCTHGNSSCPLIYKYIFDQKTILNIHRAWKKVWEQMGNQHSKYSKDP